MPHLLVKCFMSNAFVISKKTDLISRGGLQSNASNIPCVIAKSWAVQQSDGRKPNWLGFNSFSSDRINTIFSKFFQRWVREILVGSF